MTTGEEIELLPDAARTIEGLRDTGYDFLTAVADIVDNSIAAGANKVLIRVGLTPGGQAEVTVADDGCGMDETGLINAMKYGSQIRENRASLGKFGLGLKTASTSISRQLTVVTRDRPDTVHCAQWDLDYVAQSNKWLLRRPAPTDRELLPLDEAAQAHSGTVVIWRKVDRLVPTQKPGQNIRRALDRQVEALKEHLALTYVRYLSPSDERAKVRIFVNDEELTGWSPFCEDIGGELTLEDRVKVDIDGEDTGFTLRAWVLPPRPELSEEESKRARILTDNQGFYVFREDRVISAGGWLGMFRAEPHFNLCRIEFSFDHRLDDAFQIDIKKSRIRMLADLQDYVKQQITPSRYEAEQRYRKNERTKITAQSGDINQSSNDLIAKHADKLSRSVVKPVGANEVEVTNSKGHVTIRLPILEGVEGGPFIKTVENVDDGLLWSPGIIDQHKAVLLNAGHPFYQRVYMQDRDNPVGIQGLNFLLWALNEAEFAAISQSEKEHMTAVRREVSRIVRQLATELPEVEVI